MTVAVSSIIVTGFLTGPAIAFGYKGTGFDAREGRRVAVDIRSTTRKVWESHDGRRWLTIRVRSYDPLGDDWFAEARVDSRGGPLTDYRVRLLSHFGMTFCGVRSANSVHWIEGTLIGGAADSSWGSCRAPLHLVRPNKRIRWKVFGINDSNQIDEYAPSDRGWYP
jgi:hypothetical protein